MFNFFIRWKNKKASGNKSTEAKNGASEEVRTLDIHLGKVVLYQLSYARFIIEVARFTIERSMSTRFCV